MGSKEVARALKRDVFPILQQAGFSSFKTRTAWRERADTIAVVDFSSLGSYIGPAVGATSHSFCARAGLYFKALHSTPWAKDPVPHLPEEWRCQARRTLRKRIFQIWCWRPDVWYVNRRGSNLAAVVDDVGRAIREQALPWIDELGDLDRALHAFESRADTEIRRGISLETLGGALDSFARAEVASALALACRERERARAAWRRMLANPYYNRPSELRSVAEHRIALLEEGMLG